MRRGAILCPSQGKCLSTRISRWSESRKTEERGNLRAKHQSRDHSGCAVPAMAQLVSDHSANESGGETGAPKPRDPKGRRGARRTPRVIHERRIEIERSRRSGSRPRRLTQTKRHGGLPDHGHGIQPAHTPGRIRSFATRDGSAFRRACRGGARRVG